MPTPQWQLGPRAPLEISDPSRALLGIAFGHSGYASGGAAACGMPPVPARRDCAHLGEPVPSPNKVRPEPTRGACNRQAPDPTAPTDPLACGRRDRPTSRASGPSGQPSTAHRVAGLRERSPPSHAPRSRARRAAPTPPAPPLTPTAERSSAPPPDAVPTSTRTIDAELQADPCRGTAGELRRDTVRSLRARSVGRNSPRPSPPQVASRHPDPGRQAAQRAARRHRPRRPPWSHRTIAKIRTTVSPTPEILCRPLTMRSFDHGLDAWLGLWRHRPPRR